MNRVSQLYVSIMMAVLFFAIYLMPQDSHALIGIKEGDTPKSITLKDLNGNVHDVTDIFGRRPVILVFWELTKDRAFLNYSLDELRFLNGFYGKYHEKYGLEIFGIYTPEEEKDIPASEIRAVQNLIKVNRIKFPILIDKGFKIFREYGVIALPSTVMIDKTGKIGFIYPSFPIAAQPLFTEQIQKLVGIAQVAHKMKHEKKMGQDSHSVRLYNYALQMYKKGLLEQALSPLKKSIELDPNYAWSRNLTGIILWKKGNLEGAMEEFRRAIELNKSNSPAYFNYAVLLFESEKYSEAEQYLKRALSLDDGLAEAHYVLGLVYKKTDRDEMAMKELRTALTIFEKRKTARVYEIHAPFVYHRVSALFALSELYSKKGDNIQALELLRKAAGIVMGPEVMSDKAYIHRSKDLMIYE